MMITKLKTTAGVVLLALIVVSASVWICRSFAGDPPPRAKTPEPPKANPARPVEPAKVGRIILHKNMELLSMKPDGADPKNLGQLDVRDVMGYQSFSARLSPDGKNVVFGKAVMKPDGDGAQGVWPPDTLFLRPADKTAAGEQLVHVDGVEMHNWCWSPDGTKLALVTWDKERSTRNWIVDVNAKEAKELALPKFKYLGKETAMSIQDWSPDGKWLLAAGNGLFLVKADGTAPRRLTEESRVFSGHCFFSPDGRSALFVTVEGEDKSLALRTVDLTGGEIKTVAEGKNFARLEARWSPDSRRIAFCVSLKDENKTGESETTLFIADPDGRNTVTVLTEKHPAGIVNYVLTAWR